MQGFGDVAGHFRNLLTGECDVVVVGVVFGDLIAGARCANKTVRNVRDVEEAKWSALTDVQKRRFIECLAGMDPDQIQFGYAKFTRPQLRTLTDQYLLYQNVSFPPDWDLALTGYAYGEILFDNWAEDESRMVLEFDHVASQKDSDKIVRKMKEYVPEATTHYKSSHSTPGIQTADCFAGAVAEDHKDGTDWLDQLGRSDITESHTSTLTKLENDLHNYDR